MRCKVQTLLKDHEVSFKKNLHLLGLTPLPVQLIYIPYLKYEHRSHNLCLLEVKVGKLASSPKQESSLSQMSQHGILSLCLSSLKTQTLSVEGRSQC